MLYFDILISTYFYCVCYVLLVEQSSFFYCNGTPIFCNYEFWGIGECFFDDFIESGRNLYSISFFCNGFLSYQYFMEIVKLIVFIVQHITIIGGIIEISV